MSSPQAAIDGILVQIREKKTNMGMVIVIHFVFFIKSQLGARKYLSKIMFTACQSRQSL